MGKIPTLNDVAKRAGVSKSTVSRVLNNTAKISENTKKYVLEIVKALNYEPNNIARSLARKKTFTIGVLLEDIVNPFFSSVAKGIETALKKSGYSMLLTNSDFMPEDELNLTRMLLRNKVDGILITPISPDSQSISLLREKEIPFFMINCRSDESDVNWIESDNFKGGYMAARYLLDLGHRSFMCIWQTTVHGSRIRLNGFGKALEEVGLRLSDQIILKDVRSMIEGYEIVSSFIKMNGTAACPSAVFAVNDAVAIGAMESFFAHGLRIPDDISIIGYDDINFSSLVKVPLTTVHQSKYRMGETAALQLVELIEKKEAGITRHMLVKPRLVIRESCRECVVE